jgi:hypothetical protein
LSQWNALSSDDTSKVFEWRSGQTTFAAGNVELAVLQTQNDRFSRSFAEAERIFGNEIDSLFDCEPSNVFQKGMLKRREIIYLLG